MNSDINKSKFTFILYSLNKLPIVYRLNKTFLRFYLVFPALFFFISCLAILVAFNYSKITESIKKNELKNTNIFLNQKIDVLTNKINQMKKSNKTMLNRLTQGTSVSGLDNFSIIKLVSGQKFINNKRIKFEKFTITRDQENIMVDFNLLNTSEGKQKISGYLLCLIKNNSQLAFSPIANDSTKDQVFQLSFKQGESFSTSRFRPFHFKLSNIKKLQNQLIKIFIFNKLGDLIYISERNYDERTK